MTLRLLPLLPAVLLAACATAQPKPEPAAPHSQCDAESVQSYVGKAADAATMEAARKQAGAGIARILKPGQVVTMEYRIDRLNLHADDKGRITRIACG